jgi:hypothetical protein
MNPRTLFPLLSASLLALTFSGCSTLNRSSTPNAMRPVGGKSLDILALRDDVKATRLALNSTIDTLNRIPDSPAPDQAYMAFNTELTAFNKIADKTLKESDTVRNNGRELFSEWNAETESINDPEIRSIAEQRRTTLRESYNSMLTPLLTARSDLNEVRSNLTDIQKALALDLTPDGINAAKTSFGRISSKAATSVKSLDAFAAELDNIANSLPPATVTRPKVSKVN